MGDLTANLSRHEFECRCGCGFNTVNHGLVEILQDAVYHFATKHDARAKITLTSGNRCRPYNTKLRFDYNRTGGEQGANTSVNSKHIWGMAADFKIFVWSQDKWNQILPSEVADYLEDKYQELYGIGRYNSRTHFDNRSDGPARWG